jgi:regulator of protease activity HflC (stomatin/prohibitin superfamily)
MEVILALLAIGGTAALATSLRILREYERAVVFRLGRVRPLRGPGLIFLVPFGIERMVRVGLRIIAMDIPPQDVITRDNVSVKVNAVLYFRVRDPSRAVLEIEDFLFATSQLAQTTLRSVIGQAELDELLAEREKFNRILQKMIDEGTDAWGIDVTGVEVKDVDLPQEMKRAMAKQAEAERERRAKVINAEGELQAATRLKDAARLLSQHPASLQLRFLQTASEIAAENNSTTLFPLPLDLWPLQKAIAGAIGAGSEREEEESIEQLEERARASADAALQPVSDIDRAEEAHMLEQGPPQNLDELVKRVRQNVEHKRGGAEPGSARQAPEESSEE